MFPDLSYVFNYFFGTEVDNWTSIFKSFGLMLGLAFLCCGVLLFKELTRLKDEGKIQPVQVTTSSGIRMGDILWNTFVFTFLAAKIPVIMANFDGFKGNPAGIIFSGQGNWLVGILVGLVALGYLLYKKKAEGDVKTIQKLQYPHERTVDIIFIAALSGVFGGRLFSILENFDAFIKDPLGQLFSGSGLTVYGGLIVAFFAVYYFVKKIGLKPIYMMDIGGMGILLGYAVGRMGCQIAGDGDWGIEANLAQPGWWFLPDWMWSYNYPNNVNNDGVLMANVDVDIFNATKGTIEQKCKAASGMRYCHELSPKVYPTPIYEIFFSLLGFFGLYLMRKKIKIAGMLFALYLIYQGIERFFIEQIRVNERYNFLGFEGWSQAQYISLLFVLLGVAGVIYFSRKKPGWENESA